MCVCGVRVEAGVVGCGVSALPRVGSYQVGVLGGVLTLLPVHYPNETVAPGSGKRN